MPNRTNKTGSELFIVDNSDADGKGLRYLHEWCGISRQFDIASGCFELGALLGLEDDWQKVDRIRILMGEEVSLRTREAFAKGLRRLHRKLDQSLEAEKLAGSASLPICWRPRMNPDPLPKRKMSEMISEMAAPFISEGKTPEEKHHRLTAVCSAWNMACGSPGIRRQQLEQYVEGFRQSNPAISPSDLASVRKVMESLMERKLELFPDDRRQIVSAKIVMVGKDYRIEVASATL